MAKNTGQGLRSGTRVTRREVSPLTALWTMQNTSSGAFMRQPHALSTRRSVMPRGAVLLLLGLLVGVLVVALPLPGVLPTIGYVAALLLVIVGIVFLILDTTGGVRGPRV